MLTTIIELHSHNIILGYGDTFNTHVNSNIIVHGYLIINNINTLYIFILRLGVWTLVIAIGSELFITFTLQKSGIFIININLSLRKFQNQKQM